MNPSFLRFSYHMIKNTVSGRGCLMDWISYDVETCFLIAADGSFVPCSHFKIHRLARKQLPGDFPCGLRHLLSVSFAAIVRVGTDAKENF